MANETPIPLLAPGATQPAGSARSITVMLNIPGLGLVPAQMQVVTMAGADGVTIDPSPDQAWQRAVLLELRSMRQMMAVYLGLATVIPNDIPGPADFPDIS
jgi:hypothetical protein